MKTKSFVPGIVSGLLAIFLAYVAPAMADDLNSGSNVSIPAYNSMGSSMGSSPGGSMGSDNSINGSTDSTSTNSSDSASPDTATGDDDY